MALSQAERSRAYRLRHPEKTMLSVKTYHNKNREKINEKQKLAARAKRAADPDGNRAKQRQYHRANTLKMRQHQLKAKYGLTLEQFMHLLIEQGGGCAICKSKDRGPVRSWPVDHDHTTGKVRGILCQGCNNGIGYFKDDPKLLIAAAKYLTP